MFNQVKFAECIREQMTERGFGQKKGRAGFRTTFLPPEETIVRAVDMFKQNHEKFCARYA